MMPVGVIGVGGRVCSANREEGHDSGDEIERRMGGFGEDGDRAGEQTNGEFGEGKKGAGGSGASGDGQLGVFGGDLVWGERGHVSNPKMDQS